MITRLAAALAALTLLVLPQAHADDKSHQAAWLATWGSGGQLPLFNEPRTVEDQTLRQIVYISRGGDEVRVRLSNAVGKTPLVINAASVGVRAEAAAVEPGSVRSLEFGGERSITISAGAMVVSDEVKLRVKDEADLAISLYVKKSTTVTTELSTSHQTSYLSQAGDFTAQDKLEPAGTYTSWYWLGGVDVKRANRNSKAIIAFGDSITEGYGSTDDANARWPDFLSRRLIDAGDEHSVVDMAISGNRVLSDEIGPNALSRLDRDLLTQPGADTAILLEGINDIGLSSVADGTFPPEVDTRAVSAAEIIGGYQQIAQRAHDAGIRILIGTLLPVGGSDYFNEVNEAKRQAVNDYIRSNKDFDGVIDFDKATRDPADPSKLTAAFDSGDHIHPNDAGYEVMADAIDLTKLSNPSRKKASNQ